MRFGASASEGRTRDTCPLLGNLSSWQFGTTYRPQNSKVKKCKFPSWISWAFKMGPIGCPETSTRNYQPTLHQFHQKTQVLFTWRRKSGNTPTEQVAVCCAWAWEFSACISSHVRKIRWKFKWGGGNCWENQIWRSRPTLKASSILWKHAMWCCRRGVLLKITVVTPGGLVLFNDVSEEPATSVFRVLTDNESKTFLLKHQSTSTRLYGVTSLNTQFTILDSLTLCTKQCHYLKLLFFGRI